jgi:hypothetical protein
MDIELINVHRIIFTQKIYPHNIFNKAQKSKKN